VPLCRAGTRPRIIERNKETPATPTAAPTITVGQPFFIVGLVGKKHDLWLKMKKRRDGRNKETGCRSQNLQNTLHYTQSYSGQPWRTGFDQSTALFLRAHLRGARRCNSITTSKILAWNRWIMELQHDDRNPAKNADPGTHPLFFTLQTS
jgi:hypothetical protein